VVNVTCGGGVAQRHLEKRLERTNYVQRPENTRNNLRNEREEEGK
jgi:hypothetical protein